MRSSKRFGGFTHLESPKRNGDLGWYVGTSQDIWYLHPDMELYKTTGDVTTDIYPGYYNTEALANEMRDKYYAKHRRRTKFEMDAFDRAMKGI